MVEFLCRCRLQRIRLFTCRKKEIISVDSIPWRWFTIQEAVLESRQAVLEYKLRGAEGSEATVYDGAISIPQNRWGWINRWLLISRIFNFLAHILITGLRKARRTQKNHNSWTFIHSARSEIYTIIWLWGWTGGRSRRSSNSTKISPLLCFKHNAGSTSLALAIDPKAPQTFDLMFRIKNFDDGRIGYKSLQTYTDQTKHSIHTFEFWTLCSSLANSVELL